MSEWLAEPNAEEGALLLASFAVGHHPAPAYPREGPPMKWRPVKKELALSANDFQRRVSADPVKAVWRQIGRAWDATVALEFADAWELLTAVEWNIAGLSATDAAPILRELRLLQAAAYAYCDDSIAGLAVAQQMVMDRGTSAAVATTICRFAYWKQRDFKAMCSLKAASRPKTFRRREVFPAIFDISIEAAVAFERLRLPIAKRLARDAIALSETTLGQNSAAAAFPASIAAQLAYEEDRLDEAERLIGERFSAIRARGDIECAIRSFIVMARISSRRGHPDIATQILDDAKKLAERRGWPRLLAASLVEHIEIALACGRLDEAKLPLSRLERLASNPRQGDYPTHHEIRRYALIGRARLERAIAPNPQLAEVFRKLHQDALHGRQLFQALQLAVWLADSLAAIGEIDEAIETLRNALKTGAAVGLYRVFLDGGETIRNLLQILHERPGTSLDWDDIKLYLDSLLSHSSLIPATPNTKGRSNGQISERELAIIQLVGTGLPNKRIAQSLDIMPETVKTHIKNIFAKLSVKTRTEAVRRAQTLGLI
jgi:ATP/maltotriose-dependent transcriptional regulator MalT